MIRQASTNNKKLISMAVAALLLSGCQSIWPDYQRPKVAVPAVYDQQANQENSQLSKTWWTLYQDQVLNDLVAKAVQNNSDIKLSVARIEEADAVLREVGAALLPQIDLNSATSRTRATTTGATTVFANNPRSNFNAQLRTSFEIDFWGKLSRTKEAARAQALSTRYAKDTVALSLAGLVASNYLLLRSLDSQLLLTKVSLKSREESLALTQRRLEGGVVSALDVQQAEVARENLSAQLSDLNRLRSLSLHQLAVLTGDMELNIASADIQSLPIPPTPPAGLPSALLESRPDVRQAEEQMVAANANIAVAKAALYPSISLTAGFGGESMQLGDVLKSASRIWTGGLSLNLPIFDSGKLNARVDQASAKQKQVLATYEGVLQNAFREVNDALVSLRLQTEREVALNKAQLAAQKALQISENRYQSGYSAYLEVLDAQRVYNDAALTFIQSRQARLVATVSLFKALGGGWQASTVQ
ncbi:MAG: efflux transporter outer membrane subunit [Methylophilaceae bacterium]|nr:MAG: efflux transporter outer membrane subunit [Methylophilaceae bacterium]